MKICKICGQNFELNQADLDFYKKMEVPLPTLCPRDRLIRRLAFRNERSLFKRKCDKSGVDVISNLRPDAPFPVYAVDEWFKDDWSAPILPNFDFNKGFFEQFINLSRVSPRMHKATAGNEVNSPYINHAGNCKDCYFIFNSEYAQDCYYLRTADHCRDCVDGTNLFNSELCYECVNCENCYNLKFSDDCKTSRDSWFIRNCRGVQDSIFCYGLDQKRYHIFNEAHTKEEYEAKLRELKLHTWSGFSNAMKIWEKWSAQFPKIRQIIQNCENSTGDALYNCKNARDCYNCQKLEDCRYVLNSVDVKDTYDMYAYGEIQLAYEIVTMMYCYDVKFCSYVFKSDNLEYCDMCWNCHNCFGCAGLNGKSYCIFNKQYTKEEYEDLLARIKEKMKADAEYGEFFPMGFSMFPYEDTMANDYFPKKEKSSAPPTGDFVETSTLPDDVNDINVGSIVKKVYRCPETNKLFMFQQKELEFYKKAGVPAPRVSFEARYKRRNKLIPFPY